MASGFGVTAKELRQLVESGSADKLQELGGVQELSKKLKSDSKKGLEEKDDVNARVQQFGSNRIPQKPPKSLLFLMWQAAQDFTLVMLMVSAVISLVLGIAFEDPSTGWIEGTAILVSVFIVVMVTAGNDYAKEKQFRKLNAQVEDSKVNVIRGGRETQVSVYDINVGDLILLSVGDILPADGVLVQGDDLRVDESSLTGETDFIKKNAEQPYLLSGTKLMEGGGKMLAVAVGVNSQAGIIKALVTGQRQTQPDELKEGETKEGETKEEEKPEIEEENESVLQKKLEALSMQIGFAGSVVAGLCVLVMITRFFIEWYMSGEPWKFEYFNQLLNYFITGITILVVAVPEGLPLAVTLSLAFSVQRMQKDNNLVKHLDACETMGSATTICSDKTGTLTTNRMTVMRSWFGRKKYDKLDNKTLDEKFSDLFFDGVAINSTARVEFTKDKVYEHIGSKTECAMLQLCSECKYDWEAKRQNTEIAKVYTFSSARKRMSTIFKTEDGYRLYTKGASEMVLSLCSSLLTQDCKIDKFEEKEKQAVLNEVIEEFASDGLRTICLAYRDLTTDEAKDLENIDSIEQNLICIGIVGIEDPVRPQVPKAIETCRKAGIVVRMVTGDNITTAKSIAKKCGLLRDGEDAICIEGPEFRKRVLDEKGNLIQSEFDKIWPKLRVMARSSPTDKYTLVTGLLETQLEADRPVVAVTGDGTNDAPALKKADVGFAMGIAGTSVAKDACDIILMDDNFDSIVKAVKWGRNVYDSIGKFLQFQLTVNVVAITVAFLGACVLEESPLTAVQMLWVNLIMDSFASLALATEPPSDDLLKRKPYGRTKPLISHTMWLNILGHALYQIVVLLVLIFFGHNLLGVEDGRFRPHDAPPTVHFTMVFNVFVLMQIFNEVNSRKLHGEKNVFDGITNNLIFLAIWFGTFFAQFFIVQFGGRPLHCTPLNFNQWVIALVLGSFELVWNFVIRSLPDSFRKAMPTTNPATHISAGQKLWIRGVRRITIQQQVISRMQMLAHKEPQGTAAAALAAITPKSKRFVGDWKKLSKQDLLAERQKAAERLKKLQ